jgi:hypothetical protein
MKMLFSRWNNAPASMRRRLAPPAILLEKHAPPHDGNAAFPDTPSSPCQRSKTFAARPKAYEANCVFTRSYGAALGALFCTRRSRRNSRAPAALDTNDAWRRSVVGGGERNRTDDLLLAKQALSQLSYTPKVLGGLAAQNPWRRQRLPLQPREPRRAEQNTKPDTPSQILDAAPAPRSCPEPLSAPGRSRRNSRCACRGDTNDAARRSVVVGQGGFEPPTSRLSSARSNQLSY